MNERWIPVLAAVVGVLGGMGGALVGGSLANQGQEQRFEIERQAAIQDVHTEAYATYLEASIKTLYNLELLQAENEDVRSNPEYVKLVNTAIEAQSVVWLLADPQLTDVTRRLTNALSDGDYDLVQELLGQFVALARKDVTEAGG
jgi:hypothetical protein